jgi:hypothetical protein
MVQSKSELTLATYFASSDVGLGDYTYNRKLEGEGYPYRLRPDFSWETDAGELILWEHLGMLDREDYKKGWEKEARLVRREWLCRRREPVHVNGRARAGYESCGGCGAEGEKALGR